MTLKNVLIDLPGVQSQTNLSAFHFQDLEDKVKKEFGSSTKSTIGSKSAVTTSQPTTSPNLSKRLHIRGMVRRKECPLQKGTLQEWTSQVSSGLPT